MGKLRMRRVFVPGGTPELTYVQRTKVDVEKALRSASDNLCKLVTLTGPTKSGKTVSTKRVYPPSECIWVDVGSTTREEDFWDQIIDALDGTTHTTKGSAKETASELSGEASGGIKIPWVFEGGGKTGSKYGKKKSTSESGSRRIPPAARAVQLLKDRQLPLIVDDFHFLDRDVQVNVVRALKALVHDGHPVVFLAIPHRKYDVVRVEREMTGRVFNVSMPLWTDEELTRIPFVGFPHLRIKTQEGVVKRFLAECMGSPHLMQEFCRQLCEENGIEEELDSPQTIGFKGTPEELFERVAKDTSKTVFERLAKGPKTRSDRIQRQFKDGGQGDIYVAVLMAIARLRPGTITLEYDQIRASLRDVLEELPQVNEVSRVLEKMSEIQTSDDASAPVLDWDKKDQRLHVTDPFFAFFLRWGLRDFKPGEQKQA